MQIKSLQGLRIILFIIILCFHGGEMYPNKTIIFKNFFWGGGTLAVTYFFVLSGFVIGINNDYQIKTIKDYKNYIKHKVGKLYLYHIIFLFLQLPLSHSYFAKGLKALISLLLNICLLQSWIPDNEIWLGFNGPSWYLSTLIFLIAVTPLIYKLSKYIEKLRRYNLYIYWIIFDILAIFIFPFYIKKMYNTGYMHFHLLDY